MKKATLVAVLAVYFTIRLMGKVAKGLTIAVAVVAAVAVVWFVLGELELVPAISKFI